MAKKSTGKCPVTGPGPVAVACDPGKHKLAFAKVGKHRDEWATVTLGDWSWHAVWVTLKAWHVPGSVFACEEQFLKNNPKTMATLAAVRGGLEAIAEIIGYTVAPGIRPSKWQSHHDLLLWDDGRRPKSGAIKARSMMRAEVLTGVVTTDMDIADAVCMAGYLKDTLDE